MRAADDLLRLLAADVDVAEVDRLAVLLRLVSLVQDAPDHKGPRDGAAVDRLLLEPDPDQVGGHLLGGRGLLQADELGKPTGGGQHQISIPNCAENRASPSTMSCMSDTPLRSWMARSMPIPNANPL